MAEKLTEDELLQKLDSARAEVGVGAFYKHYKGDLYKVIDLAILESDDSVGVIYQAQYGKKLLFIRSLSVWLEEVELEGKTMKRFARAKGD